MSVFEQTKVRERNMRTAQSPLRRKATQNRSGNIKRSASRTKIAGSVPAALIAGVAVALGGGCLLLAAICPILCTAADPAAGVDLTALASFAVSSFGGGIAISHILRRKAVRLSFAAALAVNAVAIVTASAVPSYSVDLSVFGWLKRVFIVLLFVLGAYIFAPGNGGNGRVATNARNRSKNR